MRPLLLILLLSNVLFFFWQTQWQDDFRTEVTLIPETLPQGVDRLMLLREQATPDQPQQKDEMAGLEDPKPEPKSDPESKQEILTPTQPSESLAAESVAAICFILGPFTEKATAEQAAATIRATDSHIELRQEVERSRRAYWVYLPSAQDYKQASAMANELKLKGVKDLYIMGSGQYQNAVSLGLYRAESAAQVRFKQIQDLGFAPVLGEQFQETAMQWLSITVPPEGQAVAVDAIKGLAASYPDARLEQKTCE